MKVFRIIFISILTLFGLLSVLLTSTVLLNVPIMHKTEEHNVLFIAITNLICGILYIVAAYGYHREEKWSYKLLTIITLILVLAFGMLQLYIYRGGLYEEKTVRAMIFRMVLTTFFAMISFFTLKKQNHD